MPINIDPSFYQISGPNQQLLYGTTSPENQVQISQGYEAFLKAGGSPGTMAPTAGAAELVAVQQGPGLPPNTTDPYNTYDSVTANLVAGATPQINAYEQAIGYVNWHGKQKAQTSITMRQVAAAAAAAGKTPADVGKALAKSVKKHPKYGDPILQTRKFLRELA